MSDLSKLLEDVYRSGPSTPAAPAWSSDSALDEVFSDWVPGESEGASPAEQAFAELADPLPAQVPAETLAEMDALVQAAVDMAPDIDDEFDASDEFGFADVPELEAEPAPVVENRDELLRWTPERCPEVPEPDSALPDRSLPTFTPWCREHDDILPRRGLGGRRRGLSLRRK